MKRKMGQNERAQGRTSSKEAAEVIEAGRASFVMDCRPPLDKVLVQNASKKRRRKRSKKCSAIAFGGLFGASQPTKWDFCAN
jgi:hypothetical protein